MACQPSRSEPAHARLRATGWQAPPTIMSGGWWPDFHQLEPRRTSAWPARSAEDRRMMLKADDNLAFTHVTLVFNFFDEGRRVLAGK